jgi:hypothetical protein
MAAADGLFSGNNWQTVDATSLLNSVAASSALGLAYVESAAFTPGAITIDGIAVLVSTRIAAPVGTFTIRLAQAGVTVAGTELAINVSDVSVAENWANVAAIGADGGQGWYFFKFVAPVLLVVATAYTVSAKCSVASEISLNRAAGAGNWSRMLRTTAGGAGAVPAAGDNFWILGEWTAAGVKTNRVIDMDIAAATDYGDGVANVLGSGIGKGGTLRYLFAGATNYNLRLSTCLAVYAGGIFTMGTAASPIPRDSTAKLEFDCAADRDFGLLVFGTFTAQGLSRTIAKDIDRCKLNGDEAAGQTILSVDADTGWLLNDIVAIAGTSRAVGEFEQRTVSASAATTVTVTAGLTNAHSGTAPTQGEIILLTRNVKVTNVTAAAVSFVYCGIASQVDCDWVEFSFLGNNNLRTKGIEIMCSGSVGGSVAGSVSFNLCSIHDCEYMGFALNQCINPITTVDNVTISNCVGYLCGNAASAGVVNVIGACATVNWTITNFVAISGRSGSSAPCFYFESASGTLTTLTGANGSIGFFCEGGTTATGYRPLSGTCSGWTAHGNANQGISLSNIVGGVLSTLTIWRNTLNTLHGLHFAGATSYIVINTITAFGNTTANVGCAPTHAPVGPNMIRNGTFAGDTTSTSAVGFFLSTGTPKEAFIFETCTFGVTAGIFVAHVTSDIQFAATGIALQRVVLRNCLLTHATLPVQNLAQIAPRGGVFYQMKNQVAGAHETNYGTLISSGTITRDAGVFKTAAPSEKLTPTSATATVRLRSRVRRIPVKSGEAMAVSVWVRKTAAYAGSAVRLCLWYNAAIGASFTVLDSMTAAADTWEQLTGTCTAATADGVLEIFVDCDGNAGSVYVDDWAAAVA